MSKIFILGGEPAFYCPGCKENHRISVNSKNENTGSKWSFNADYLRPTFHPSINVRASKPLKRCHSFVRDGYIQFLGDCFHDLAGQTIELPNINEFGELI